MSIENDTKPLSRCPCSFFGVLLMITFQVCRTGLHLLTIAFDLPAMLFSYLSERFSGRKEVGLYVPRENGYVLITGASKGIGKQIALEFSKKGFQTILVARTETLLQEVREEIKNKFNMESKYFVIDLSNKTELEKLYTLTKNLRIDILVLNAGLTHVSDFIQTKPKQIETILNLNIFSYQNLIHHYVMPMVERHNGRILTIGSIMGLAPTPCCSIYAASKAFQVHLSTILEYELSGTGVHITTANPGATVTEMFKNNGGNRGWAFWILPLTAKHVAQQAVTSCLEGYRNVTIGWLNILIIYCCRFLTDFEMCWSGRLFMQDPKLDTRKFAKQWKTKLL